ncbi:MAG: DUF115 domain-containing protein [Spirochaetales bacterium]|nr:DUF115 domain-containing protein [Spirochaetales bacterium]
METDKPLLIETGSGFTVRYKGRYLYSSQRPRELIEKRVDGFELEDRTLYIVPSIGLGYGLDILERKCPASSHVLCIEIDEILMKLYLEKGPVGLPDTDRLSVIRTGNPLEVVRYIRRLGTYRFRRVRMLSCSGGYHLYAETYKEMVRLLEEEITTYWKNKMTLLYMAPLWIRHIFYNLVRLHAKPDITVLRDISSLAVDLPVLVIGAGPSLDGTIETIKRIRKRVVLVAVDTAYGALCEHAITPDFIVILESQIANLKDFVTHRDPGIPVICDVTAHPATLRFFNGPLYLFSSSFFPVRLLDRLKAACFLPTQIPALGSVGGAALYVAMRMTDGPVLVTGLDFGYSDGRTHAKGTPYPLLLNNHTTRFTPLEQLVYGGILKRPLVDVAAKGGGRLLSDLVLRSYALEVTYITAGKTNIFDIGKTGMNIGLPLLKDDGEIDRVLFSPRGEGKTDRPESGVRGGRVHQGPQSVCLFLADEKACLDRAEKLLTARLESLIECERDFSHEERDILDAIDYAWLHFPDPLPLPVAEKGFLFRLLVSVRYYNRLMDRALLLLEKNMA